MNFSTFNSLVRFEQTLFGLPLMMAGALLPFADAHFLTSLSRGEWIHWMWVFPAFICARISGMSFNQLIDRHIDAQNPRTKNRSLPSGRASPTQAALIAWGALLFFLLICWQINFLCFLVSLSAAFLLATYSYMKRLHLSCHFVLGLIHFLGPVMASIAISGKVSAPSFYLGVAAFLLIVGNDIAYALQDYEFDRASLLHSAPSRLGIEKSLWLAKGLHFFCPLLLLIVGWTAHLPLIYYGIIPVVLAVLILFHRSFSKERKKIEPIFFLCNATISFTVFLFVFISVIWVVMS
ncbi:MAG: 4-hydroxybenzoate octaprenyltransferase [Chlamydiales bacterium]